MSSEPTTDTQVVARGLSRINIIRKNAGRCKNWYTIFHCAAFSFLPYVRYIYENKKNCATSTTNSLTEIINFSLASHNNVNGFHIYCCVVVVVFFLLFDFHLQSPLCTFFSLNYTFAHTLCTLNIDCYSSFPPFSLLFFNSKAEKVSSPPKNKKKFFINKYTQNKKLENWHSKKNVKFKLLDKP